MIYFDIKQNIIPDRISISLIVVGLILSFFTIEPGWVSSFCGAFFGFALFYLIAWLYQSAKKEIGLGGGDVKYLAAIGAFYGIQSVFFVIFISSGLALLFYVFKHFFFKKLQKFIPYGPFLVVSGFLYVFSGKELILLYLRRF